MTRLFTRVMILISLSWLGYATADMLGSSADFLRAFNAHMDTMGEMKQIGMFVRLEYASAPRPDEALPRNRAQLMGIVKTYLEADGRQFDPARTGRDQWGTEFGFAYTSTGFSLYSAGPDRSFRTKDDQEFPVDLRRLGYKGGAGQAGQPTPSRRRGG